MILVYILEAAIFARAILSWFTQDQHNLLYRILFDVTEPILAPLRKVVPQIGMIDLTFMVAIIVLVVVQQAIARA